MKTTSQFPPVSALLLIVVIFFATAASAQAPRKTFKGYGPAVTSLSDRGKYVQHWLVAGPFKPTAETTEEARIRKHFESYEPQIVLNKSKSFDPLKEEGVSRSWEIVDAINDAVDFNRQFGNIDFAHAYAMCEIKADIAQPVLLAFGSDDAIRVWLNGKLVHDKWALRALTKDEDILPVQLVKGSNQLVVKVQDMQGDWGFSARMLSPVDIQDRFITACAEGDFENYELLSKVGATLDGSNSLGLTALMAAKLNGQAEMAAELVAKGAKPLPMPAPEILVNDVYKNLQGREAPGIALLISRNGKVVYRKAHGYADLENKALAGPETKFKIGSITKQFTGAAILKLQEEGKLSVEDKLSKYIPDFPRGDEVTVHHLLTHTSGIHSVTSNPDFPTRVVNHITEDDLLDVIRKAPYDFNPGETFLYNNSAYVLLGYIIHKVTGVEYGDYLKKTFFEPLGMANTGYCHSNIKLENLARGYEKRGAAYFPAPVWDLSWAGGAGALYSTVDDLYKWNEALFSGKVISEKSLKSAFTPVRLNNGDLSTFGEYGYGWMMNDFRGLRRISHGGGLAGYVSELTRYPSENMTVVMLTNLLPSEQNLDPNTVASYYVWEKLAPRPPRVQGESDLSKYPGRYDFGNGMVMIITAEDKRLFAQLTGQPKFEVFPQGSGEYFWKVVNAKIKFVQDSTGSVTHGDFEQNGMKLKVSKLPAQQIVTVDKNLYTKYSGKYNLGNNMVIDITAENDRIYVQATNQPRYEIYPVSETEFVLRESNSKLTFAPPDQGKSKKLILQMGERKIEAERLE